MCCLAVCKHTEVSWKGWMPLATTCHPPPLPPAMPRLRATPSDLDFGTPVPQVWALPGGLAA